jgi:uncharacterized protein involved in exopolysaccharide biosynthesis
MLFNNIGNLERKTSLKYEILSNNRGEKRQYLNNAQIRDLMERLNHHFQTIVEIERIMRGDKQEIEMLINGEALLFAKYLRNERQTWNPRIACLEQKS